MPYHTYYMRILFYLVVKPTKKCICKIPQSIECAIAYENQ